MDLENYPIQFAVVLLALYRRYGMDPDGTPSGKTPTSSN